MSINRPTAISFLKESDFKGLFREILGWSRTNDSRTFTFNDQKFTFEGFAQQAGVTAYACRVPDVTALDYSARVAIERAVSATFPSHLFVFFDDQWQVWQWSRRELGHPRQLRSVGPFRNSSSFEPILQKLDVLAFDVESGNVQATDVDQRLKEAFNVEPVTKKFYTEFQKQYEAFLAAIEGIATGFEREFASLMLNRLMFLYFIQSKGFFPDVQVNGLKPTDYLLGKFRDKATRVKDKSDYLHGFLVPLFFEVLSVRLGKRTPANTEIFGDLIYLNGGLFSQRDWEKGPKVTIPDAAFEKIFQFFGEWNWQLDERPTKAGNEINPDVLGYVFEKFINQKQMGAYYTKEDITGYISQNTILPFLFEKSDIGVERPLELLRQNIERYVYPAVKHGHDLPLPPDIEAGIGDVSKRGNWNKSAPRELGLPTEIWREVVARRERFENLVGPTIRFLSASDLITHNLDIAQWFTDFIADLTDAGELERLWTALVNMSVLDPTVGSGAFLFAAMGVLQPVYNACLERMEGFVREADARASKQEFKAASSFQFFRDVLDEIDDPALHPNRSYAIFKKLTVQNLFGVDIMPEASEICKLRLFLKLAAQVSPDQTKPNLGIEPLPDIDFNIRSGNTLVGFATLAEVERVAVEQLALGVTGDEIKNEMRQYGEALDNFRLDQLKSTTNVTKSDIQKQHDTLVEKLNRFNAGLYGQMPQSQPDEYAAWKKSHQPFHWCAEFYTVIKNGGFDVIIGNPPYVEYPSKDVSYIIKGYATERCGDLYAFTIERASKIQNVGSKLGLIVPISLFNTDGFLSVQKLCRTCFDKMWVSSYSNRPAQIFLGAQKRLSIILASKPKNSKVDKPDFFSTPYYRWKSEEREDLMSGRLSYTRPGKPFTVFPASLEKLGSDLERSAFLKLTRRKEQLTQSISSVGQNPVHYTRKFGYFLAFTNFVPSMTNIKTGKSVLPSELKQLTFSDKDTASAAIAILSSSTFFWFWNVLSDCRNLNRRDLLAFPLNIDALDKNVRSSLANLGAKYGQQLQSTSRTMTKSGLKIQTFDYSKSKPIIDQIDQVLGEHYEFTPEELDFIINYDIKYRMGRDASDD